MLSISLLIPTLAVIWIEKKQVLSSTQLCLLINVLALSDIYSRSFPVLCPLLPQPCLGRPHVFMQYNRSLIISANAQYAYQEVIGSAWLLSLSLLLIISSCHQQSKLPYCFASRYLPFLSDPVTTQDEPFSISKKVCFNLGSKLWNYSPLLDCCNVCCRFNSKLPFIAVFALKLENDKNSCLVTTVP